MDTQKPVASDIPIAAEQSPGAAPPDDTPEASGLSVNNATEAKPSVQAAKSPKVAKKTAPPKKRARKKPVARKSVTTSARSQGAQRPFPRVTLDTALQIAVNIKSLNGGNAWDTAEVAKAVGLSSKSEKFFYLTAASRDFGLTLGTRNTARIELAELGRDIVYAPNSQVEHEKKVEAFLSVDILKKY